MCSVLEQGPKPGVAEPGLELPAPSHHPLSSWWLFAHPVLPGGSSVWDKACKAGSWHASTPGDAREPEEQRRLLMP